jgi:hypothetical protein
MSVIRMCTCPMRSDLHGPGHDHRCPIFDYREHSWVRTYRDDVVVDIRCDVCEMRPIDTLANRWLVPVSER